MMTFEQIKEYGVVLLIILGVIASGLLIVNQFISFRYKAILSQDPCTICSESRPEFAACVEGLYAPAINQLPTNLNVNLSFINDGGEKR